MYTEITKLIDNKNIVSFDVFDTLLLRNVAKPTDIFKIMESIVKEKYGIDNFSQKRIQAENNARKTVENGETNIDEIYIKLEKEIKDKSIVNEIKKRELEIEEEFIVQNPFMKKVFDYCVKNKKKIIFISNMYMSTSFINKLLKKCDYSEVDYKLYISCEYRKNKENGELYKLISNNEKINYNEWIHIGDNYKKDYAIPKELGIEAFYYKDVNSYENIEYSSVFESIILGVRNNYLYNGNEIDYWEKFGIKNIMPIYVGFTNWIYQMTYKYDNIFFLARDGYIIEKIYKLFPGNKFTKYIYCSRNSVEIPTALSETKEDIIKFILGSIQDDIPLKKLFNMCKLQTKNEYENIIKLYGFNSFEDKVAERKKYDALNCVLAVFDDAKTEILKEREIVKKYLIQEGLNDFDKIIIMDVGWGGSIQRSIQKLLGKGVRGYYFGTLNQQDYNFNYDSFGYMFDQDNDIFDKARIFDQAMMYELFFSAPHGSVEKYEENEGKIIPILQQPDNHSNIIEIFQNACLKIIKEIMKYYQYYDNINKYFCFDFYRTFLEQYNYEDLVEFSKLENDYLIGNDKKFPYVQTFTKEYVLNNYDKFDEITKKSLWRGAFLIEGCNTEEEYNAIIKKARMKYYPEHYPSKSRKIIRRMVPLKIRKMLKSKV